MVRISGNYVELTITPSPNPPDLCCRNPACPCDKGSESQSEWRWSRGKKNKSAEGKGRKSGKKGKKMYGVKT